MASLALAASRPYPSKKYDKRIEKLCEQINKPFKGKSACITGGARGIGRGGKYPLATDEDLEETMAAIENYGVQCLAMKGDVRDRAQLTNAMEETVSTFGSLDFLIGNAGITQVGELDSFSDAEVQTEIDVNLGGIIKTVQAATPHLRAQKSGRIVLTSSVTGRGGSALFPVYSATKWGIIGLAKATAQAHGPFNVTCNAICPDIVHTKLLDNDYILGAIGAPDFETFSNVARDFHHYPLGHLNQSKSPKRFATFAAKTQPMSLQMSSI